MSVSSSADTEPLPGTEPLRLRGDFADIMVAGIDKFLMRELKASVARRAEKWQRNFSSHRNYIKSIKGNRQRFLKIIGVVDPREPVEMQLVATTSEPALVGEGAGYKVYGVRWNVLKGVDAEGLLLQPDQEPVADIVALPDCDWTPEMLVGLTPGVPEEAQFARRLAENGCQVLVPMLIDRRDTHSGVPEIGVMTNQPHREFIYRAAFEMGRHIIGYEVQKVLAAVDWFSHSHLHSHKPIGVIGYGEGGLLAFYAGAADTRIDAVAVCGYFQPRESLWREPIYRNVWGLLDEFGDAEIATLISPRTLVIEACRHPEITGPPAPQPGRGGAAPGILTTPPLADVESEVRRTRALLKGLTPRARIALIKNTDAPPGSDRTLVAFLKGLGIKRRLPPPCKPPKHIRNICKLFNAEARLKRQFQQLVEHTQYLMREAEFHRTKFWAKADATNAQTWEKSCRWYREYLWDEVIGRFPPATLPTNPRTRLIYDEPRFRGYEVMLDVYPDVFAYGILLVPNDIQPSERRPVIVCQHGLEGRPQKVTNPKIDEPPYIQFACKLAQRGFVTYSPQNPYIGGDKFRILQRKANPLKKSLFAIIVRQHERTLQWLCSLPFVDPNRIAFYGISYGGKTAMRVPALLGQYCLSICSADYNEWIWKNVSARHSYSYLLTCEYEMFEFDIGNTFNYAELSWLICPRPFMVERGHDDGVAPDEWVAYEYAKTKRRYDLFGIGDRTEIEFFNGGHTINGVGTFEFLHHHLKWGKP